MFDPSLVHVEFVVDKVAAGPIFLRVLRFHLVSIIPSLLYMLPVSEGRTGVGWEPSRKNDFLFFLEIGRTLGIKAFSPFFVFIKF